MPIRHTLRTLSLEEFKLLCLSMPLVIGMRVMLWVLPSRRILRVLRRLVDTPERPSAGRRPSLERIAWAIDAASRRVPRASCLTQALASQLLLRHYGYASRLCVGVQRDEGGVFRAHAWIEREGRILVGGARSRAFTRLEFPTGSQVRSLVNS